MFGKAAREVIFPSYHTRYQDITSNVNFDLLGQVEFSTPMLLFFPFKFSLFYCFVFQFFQVSLDLYCLDINKKNIDTCY